VSYLPLCVCRSGAPIFHEREPLHLGQILSPAQALLNTVVHLRQRRSLSSAADDGTGFRKVIFSGLCGLMELSHRRTLLLAQSRQIINGQCDEPSTPVVQSCRCRRKYLKKIKRGSRDFRPRSRRRGKQKLFELFLAKLHRHLIGSEAMQFVPSQFGLALGRHTAVSVQIDGLVCHLSRAL